MPAAGPSRSFVDEAGIPRVLITSAANFGPCLVVSLAWLILTAGAGTSPI